MHFGFSNVPPAGQVARNMPGAPVGGVAGRDSLAWAAEQEACKDDGREKLREPPRARRRHPFVVVDGSSGAAFSAPSHGLIGRLPELCDPITTVWVAGTARVLVTAPPGGWEERDPTRGLRGPRSPDRALTSAGSRYSAKSTDGQRSASRAASKDEVRRREAWR